MYFLTKILSFDGISVSTESRTEYFYSIVGWIQKIYYILLNDLENGLGTNGLVEVLETRAKLLELSDYSLSEFFRWGWMCIILVVIFRTAVFIFIVVSWNNISVLLNLFCDQINKAGGYSGWNVMFQLTTTKMMITVRKITTKIC